MVSSKLDFKKLFLNLVNNLDSAELVCLYLVGHIGNDKCDENLQSDNDVLNADGKEDYVCSIPEVWVSLFKELSKHGLLFREDVIEILIPANWHFGETAEKNDKSIAWDRKVRDKAHD